MASVVAVAPAFRAPLILAAWTLLVWTTRIRNIWDDETLSLAGQVGRTALALAFTGFAVATILGWWRARRGATPGWLAPTVAGFAVWTIGVWVVRGVQIALADHSIRFVVVHLVLAAASIGLAGAALRSPVSARIGRPAPA